MKGHVKMQFKHLGAVIAIFTCLVSVSFAQDIDSVKAEIYSKIHCCACKETFAQCVCPEAKEMKAYIEALLEAGVRKEEIYYKAAKKYSLNVITDHQIKAGIERRLIDEAGAKRPQLLLEPRSFDFGELRKHQGVAKRIFKISNKGTDKLVITNMKTSCACVSVSLKTGEEKSPFFATSAAPPGWQAVIDAGKSGDLEIAVDLQHSSVKPGKLVREVRIFSNDPLYPEAIVMLEGEVKDQHNKEGGCAAVDKFFANLRIFCLAESLGGVESLISYPAGMTHSSMPLEERLRRGITDNFIRVSVGIENKYDLKEDLEKALSVL